VKTKGPDALGTLCEQAAPPDANATQLGLAYEGQSDALSKEAKPSRSVEEDFRRAPDGFPQRPGPTCLRIKRTPALILRTAGFPTFSNCGSR